MMDKSEQLEDFTIRLIDIIADVEVGKNLQCHLTEISNEIDLFNNIIDVALTKSEKVEGRQRFVYQLYRIRDDILKALC